MILALLLLTSATAARATALFSAPSLLFDTGPNPTSAAIADLNGDGKLDLAVTNSCAYGTCTGPTVAVMLGNGDGTFESGAEYEVGPGPGTVVIADLNEDGLLDLAVPVNFGSGLGYSGAVSVLLGNGNGTFQTRTDIIAGPYVASVAIADMNVDGRKDLVVAHRMSGTIAVLPGNGNGTFGAGIPFAAGGAPRALAIADIDQDGRLDVVTNGGYDDDTEDYVGAGSALLGNGDGTFGAPISFETGYNPSSVAIGDFNGDTRPDLAVADYGHTPDYFGTVSILTGNGDGTFGARHSYNTGVGPVAVAVADLDGDGQLDLAIANGGDDPDWDHLANSVSVFLGYGNGTFHSSAELIVGESPGSLAIADLDANGSPDLVTANLLSNSVSVLLGNADGTFGGGSFGTGGPASSVAVGDLNGDGRPDLATANFGGTVSMLPGNGDGRFGAGPSFSTGPSPYSLAIADFNADGKQDLVTANFGANPTFIGTVSVLLGSGGGVFAPRIDYPVGNSPSTVVVADLNADARPDLVVANSRSNTVSVMLGNGDGTFGARTDFGTGLGPWSLTIGDINGDGRLDLVTDNTSSPRTFSVLLGNGDGTFAARSDFASGILWSNALAIALADINADGRQDLVSGLFVRLGNGDGTFGARMDFPAWGGPGSVAVADFNSDGRLDVAVAYPLLQGVVSVRLGSGDGTFERPSLFGAGRMPYSVAAADLNADGRPDLAVANATSQTVSVLTNLRRSVRPRERRYPATPRGGLDAGLSVGQPLSMGPTAGAADQPESITVAIRGAGPRPGGRLPIEFVLPNGAAARLELLDVAGRALASQQVGSFGPGRHTLDLSQGRALVPGIYFLHLTQGGREARACVAVLR